MNDPAKKEVNIKIFNNMGQLVFSKNIYPIRNDLNEIIDVSSLPKGIYLMKITNNNKYFKEKIILK